MPVGRLTNFLITMTYTSLQTVYDLLDVWLQEYDAASKTFATRRARVEIKLLKSMAQYAPVLPPDGTSHRTRSDCCRHHELRR